jgi:hypothetical protein
MKKTLTLLEKLRLWSLYRKLLVNWEEIKRVWRDEPPKEKKRPSRHEK